MDGKLNGKLDPLCNTYDDGIHHIIFPKNFLHSHKALNIRVQVRKHEGSRLNHVFIFNDFIQKKDGFFVCRLFTVLLFVRVHAPVAVDIHQG